MVVPGPLSSAGRYRSDSDHRMPHSPVRGNPLGIGQWRRHFRAAFHMTAITADQAAAGQ